jgi:predicted nucleic acid-binding protein
MKRVFLDANVLLDFLDSERTRHEDTKTLFTMLIDCGCTIVITEDILTTTYYVVSDKPKFLDWLAFVQDNWEIVTFGPDVIRKAVSTCRSDSSLDLEDVLQSLSAERHACDCIVTNDGQFYTHSVPCLNTSRWIESQGR